MLAGFGAIYIQSLQVDCWRKGSVHLARLTRFIFFVSKGAKKAKGVVGVYTLLIGVVQYIYLRVAWLELKFPFYYIHTVLISFFRLSSLPVCFWLLSALFIFFGSEFFVFNIPNSGRR